jgi:hypothetical protein
VLFSPWVLTVVFTTVLFEFEVVFDDVVVIEVFAMLRLLPLDPGEVTLELKLDLLTKMILLLR